MRQVIVAALLLGPLLAGCAEKGPTAPPGGPGAAPQAPWWPVGAAWDITFTRGDEAPRTVRMVNFANHSDHFWLGVADRRDSLDHALHDTNPFLGRVHWELLAPHEGNRHAMMYRFPLQEGDRFTSGNPFFGREWSILVSDAEGWRLTGSADDGARIAYDYDPTTQWFRGLVITDAAGANVLTARVDARTDGATGTYWFHRGRDYHEGPEASGAHDETFEVPQEEREVKSLVVELDLAFGGPYRVELLRPDGSSARAWVTPGTPLRETVEVPAPPQGTWTVRYVGTGDVTGRLDVTGILEYTATL